MGLSIRIFTVEEDDTLKRLPMTRFDRLLKRDPDESLPKYAGKRVRYALIVVELINRRPKDTNFRCPKQMHNNIRLLT